MTLIPLTLHRPEWHHKALCRAYPPDWWHPTQGNANGPTARRARNICNTYCPVREKCLNWAIEHGEEGIWGGLNAPQRRELAATAPADTAPKQVCRNGHLLVGTNVYVRPSNGRVQCRQCHREQSARWARENRERQAVS